MSREWEAIIAIMTVTLLLLMMRHWDWISQWRINRADPYKPLLYRVTCISKKELRQEMDWREAWSRGKQVTFMEPSMSMTGEEMRRARDTASSFVKVDRHPIGSTIRLRKP